MDQFLDWLKHWLPLIQGFAALASVGGALLSWKYAIKAERARAEMTANLVASRLLDKVNHSVSSLRKIVDECHDGEPSRRDARYYSRHREIKLLTEDCAASLRAAQPHIKYKFKNFDGVVSSVWDAAVTPQPDHVDLAVRRLVLLQEELSLFATTKQYIAQG